MKNSYAPLKVLVFIACLFVVMAIPDDEHHALAQSGIAIKKPVKVTTVKRKAKTAREIASLDEALKTGLPVILKLGSDKCRPCLAMEPIIKELAAEQDGQAVFLALDVYQNRDLANKYGVRLIPTVVFFDKHGRPKAKKEGFMDKTELLKAVADLELNK
jgi:thioredoxin 1